MTPQQRKTFNTIFGTLLLSVGLLSWGLTAYYAVTPQEPAPAPVAARAPVDVGSCRNALAELGYTAAIQQGKVEATTPLTDNPKEQLERASVGVLVCQMELESFCIGEGCDNPGVSFVLRQPA